MRQSALPAERGPLRRSVSGTPQGTRRRRLGDHGAGRRLRSSLERASRDPFTSKVTTGSRMPAPRRPRPPALRSATVEPAVRRPAAMAARRPDTRRCGSCVPTEAARAPERVRRDPAQVRTLRSPDQHQVGVRDRSPLPGTEQPVLPLLPAQAGQAGDDPAVAEPKSPTSLGAERIVDGAEVLGVDRDADDAGRCRDAVPLSLDSFVVTVDGNDVAKRRGSSLPARQHPRLDPRACRVIVPAVRLVDDGVLGVHAGDRRASDGAGDERVQMDHVRPHPPADLVEIRQPPTTTTAVCVEAASHVRGAAIDKSDGARTWTSSPRRSCSATNPRSRVASRRWRLRRRAGCAPGRAVSRRRSPSGTAGRP